jgi:long-chain acyl-CoA synthetase
MSLARRLAPLALALLLLPSAASAAPGTMKVGGDDLALNGSGMRKATFLKVKVYLGSLYLKEKQSDAKAILGKSQPWAVRMAFVRDVSKEDLSKAVKDGVAKNAPTKATKYSAQTDKLIALFPEAKNGQVVTITFETSGKTTVLLGNKKLGSIASDTGFGSALLSAWIGPKPPNAELKKGMVGG